MPSFRKLLLSAAARLSSPVTVTREASGTVEVPRGARSVRIQARQGGFNGQDGETARSGGGDGGNGGAQGSLADVTVNLPRSSPPLSVVVGGAGASNAQGQHSSVLTSSGETLATTQAPTQAGAAGSAGTRSSGTAGARGGAGGGPGGGQGGGTSGSIGQNGTIAGAGGGGGAGGSSGRAGGRGGFGFRGEVVLTFT